MRDLDKGRDCACAGQGLHGTSPSSAETKTALK